MLRLRTFGGLWMESSKEVADARPRPRRLALLAILAAAGNKGMSRERLLGILWPDSEPDRARHALSQTLYSLRRDVGADIVVATAQDLRLDPTQISSDLADCRAAIRAEDWNRAAELYRGPFLDGFYLADAEEFERWVDEERLSISKEAAKAIEAAARSATEQKEFERAAGLWRTLTAVDPLSSRFAAAYMQALMATGESGGALAHAKAHADAVRRELNAEPDAAVTRLADQLRETSDPPQVERRRAVSPGL
ncbi:MAG: BTAD domain-containing putative transcriptional regulator, partial [Gemmatimonadota bacterium]